MHLIRVAAAVLNQTPLDWSGNRDRIIAAIDEARHQGASLLCLPELCISGYGCEDMFLSPGVQRTAVDVLREILPATRGMIVSLGLPLAVQHGLFNVACLAVEGKIAGFVGKRYLASDGIHYEPRWFKPWPTGQSVEVAVGGERYPLGDLFFDCGGVRIGFEICEDAWVADRPGSRLAARGIDIILNPSASHFAFGKYEVRHRFVLEGSRAFGVSYVYSNLLGNESGRAIYDGGALIAAAGQIRAEGSRFSYADVQVTSAQIDLDDTRMRRSRSGTVRANIDGEPTCIRVPFDYPYQEPEAEPVSLPAWERGPNLKQEEFARAVSLALFDYMRKSQSSGFVVSISGGADSAAVSCLVALLVSFGVKELGRERFIAKAPYIASLKEAANVTSMVRALLACVYQSTENSSTTTREAARAVATAIGAEFIEFDVDRIVKDYIAMVAKGIGRELTWDRDDIALQNIQARARSPGVWMLTNLRNALLLSTSNRSEAAVGYATMDGDTSGGLSPIAGIDKAFLRRWLRWLETTGPDGLGPIPALSAINVQAPTAELRPAESGQTDEADLMPYELLDAVERAAIRDKLMPLEVFLRMRSQLPQYSSQDLGVWIERFFRLWCRNQWKRERYAPSFHVDDENLDPKTWCRFPILSGGFDRELGELRAYLAKSTAKDTSPPQ